MLPSGPPGVTLDQQVLSQHMHDVGIIESSVDRKSSRLSPVRVSMRMNRPLIVLSTISLPRMCGPTRCDVWRKGAVALEPFFVEAGFGKRVGRGSDRRIRRIGNPTVDDRRTSDRQLDRADHHLPAINRNRTTAVTDVGVLNMVQEDAGIFQIDAAVINGVDVAANVDPAPVAGTRRRGLAGE